MRKLNIFVFSLTLLYLPGMSVDANDNLKKGLAKAQYMLRQANSEKAAVQKQLTETKKESEGLNREIELLKKDLAKANKRIEKLKSTNGVWQDEYEKLKTSLQDTRINLAKTVRLGELQEERFVIQTENFGMCQDKNAALYSLNQEVLDAYSDESFQSLLEGNDNFFGLKRVKLENILQDYQYRSDDLNLQQNDYLVQDVGPVTERINSFN